MNVVVVTGFAPISGHPRSVSTYDQLGGRLVELREAPVRPFRGTVENCWLAEHVPVALLSEATGSLIRADVEHAVGDNPKKNSLAYHIVQHQKTAWLAEVAKADPAADVLVWIDYGIFHQPNVTPAIIDAFLRRVRLGAQWGIASPGAWGVGARSREQPNWRFLGSTLVVLRSLAGAFHAAVRDVTLQRLREERFVTWEVNDWADVELRNELPFQWYPGDHDQTQFTNYRA